MEYTIIHHKSLCPEMRSIMGSDTVPFTITVYDTIAAKNAYINIQVIGGAIEIYRDGVEISARQLLAEASSIEN